MSERGVMSRLLAFVHALLPEDWFGRAGRLFSETADAISGFAEEHQVRPKDFAHEGVELARTALHGKANKDLAAAVKDFADAERTNIEIELQRRSMECKLRKEEAEAALAELQVVHSEADLLKKLKDLGVVLHKADSGHLTVLPATSSIDLEQLAERRIQMAVTKAERVILAAILLDNSALPQVTSVMTSVDFSTESHRLIFQCMVDLEKGRLEIDFINLITLLKEQGRVDDVGGINYVTGLTEDMPRLRNIRAHVEFVMQAKERAIKAAGGKS